MKQSNRKIIAAGIIGNVIEYYDFALIGFLAVMMGNLFFPSDDPFLSLLGSLGAFAAGMIMRPIGALIFGHIGDRIGRRFALMSSLVLMALPTFLIGVLPTYEQIGMIAPILLVGLRMVQGLSVGGEYASSIVYLVEQSEPKRQNLYGSFVSIGAKIGMALGSGVCAVLVWQLGEEQMGEWGWRIPFLLSVLIALAGLYLRRNLADNYEPQQEKKIPAVEIFRGHKRLFFRFVSLASVIWMFYYTLFIYLPLWLHDSAGFTKADAGTLNTVSILVGAAGILAMAILADRYGAVRIMRYAALMTAIISLPLMMWMGSGGYWEAMGAIVVWTLLLCAYQAPIFATTVQALSYHGYRASFTALILGSAAGIVGGSTPALMSMLVEWSGSIYAPAYLISLTALAGWRILHLMHD